MSRRGAVVSMVVLPLLLLAAAPTPSRAQSTRGVTLAELARAWSGNSQPICRDTVGLDEFNDYQPVARRECEWSDSGDVPPGRIHGAFLDSKPPSGMLTWERPGRDADDTDRVIDSLSAVFAARGMERGDCGEKLVPSGRVRGTTWVGTDLVVHLERMAPWEGVPLLLLTAVDDARVMPEMLMCGVRARRRA